MIYVFGDIHITISTSFYKAAFRSFLDWLNKLPTNSDQDEVVLLGDITDTTNLTDDAIVFVERLYTTLSTKFSSIYIVVGNHDIRQTDKGEVLLSYKYLSTKPNVHIVQNPLQRYTIQGIDCLFYPYLKNVTNVYNMYHKMVDGLKQKQIAKADIAFGHLTLKEAFSKGSDSLPPEDVWANDKIFGHLHYVPDHYDVHPGSVWANSIAETGQDRYYVTLNRSEPSKPIVKQYHKYPQFLDFQEIEYPNLPRIDNTQTLPVVAYTVIGNVSDATAKEHYQNYHVYRIRNTLYQQKLINKKECKETSSDAAFVVDSFVDVLDNMMDETKIKISDKGLEILRSVLKDEKAIPKRRIAKAS